MGAAYAVAQVFGWNWSAPARPRTQARFARTYSATLVLGTALVVAGFNPLKLTMFTMAATCLTLPAVAVRLVALMNDEHYLKDHRNNAFANVTMVAVVLLIFILALVSIPVQIFGS